MASLKSQSNAWIDGRAVSLEAATVGAAELLLASRQPLIAGLGADSDGVRAAIGLAQRLGGIIDHSHSDWLLRDLDCWREGGAMMTTPNEAKIRADVLLLVGDGLTQAWPELVVKLLKTSIRQADSDSARQIIWLSRNADDKIAGFDGALEIVACGAGAEFAASLAALRARAKGAKISTPNSVWDVIALRLRSAKFGVAIWAAGDHDALCLEMLNGLVRDLNETTRFSALPLAPPENGAGALAACGWLTGAPMRTGFGAGELWHDPWRYDAERVARSGESDCALWISAFGGPAPAWGAGVKFIALDDGATPFAAAPQVRIRVGQPGLHHAGVLHSAQSGTLIGVGAPQPNDAPSVAQAIGAILAQIDRRGARPC